MEQFALGINMYGDTIDLNMVTDRIGIVGQFLQNARVNGAQAMQSLDRLARNALYAGYLGGNTRVRVAATAAAATVAVDDTRGFNQVFVQNGQVASATNAGGSLMNISGSTPLAVTVNGNPYSVIAVTNDATNVSTAPSGTSGVLTFSGNVAVADAALNMAVISVTAPMVIRPNFRASTAALQATDTLTLAEVLTGVATMRSNNVPTVDATGMYHCYMDDQQMRGLYQDPQFQTLYRGAYGSAAYTTGTVMELLGVRFITTTEAPQQASLGAGAIRRGMLVGQGALIEGDFEGIGAHDVPIDEGALSAMVDGVMMVTREPMDRLRQIVAQSWYWIGGYTLPTDVTATTSIIPTATSSYLKRGVILESV